MVNWNSKLLVLVGFSLFSAVVIAKEQYRFSVDTIPDSFIVKLKNGVSVSSHIKSFLAEFDSKHDQVKLEHEYRIGNFQGYAITVKDTALLHKLSQHSDIDLVEPDLPCSIDGSTIKTQKNAPWNLVRLTQRKLLPTYKSYKYDSREGAGTAVYVFDTGVRTTHQEFEGRASWGTSFSDDLSPTKTDKNGHGTNVAGIIAGRKYGVAKKASIIAVKVLRNDGSGRLSWIIAGLDWVYRKYKSDKSSTIINISISSVEKHIILDAAINRIVENGVHVVVAAGNNNVNACDISPASAEKAITVGSIGNRDQMSDFSNYGKCIDILAPGEGIMAAYKDSDSSFAAYSGTSQAAPHIAGMKALLLASSKEISVFGLDFYLKSISTKDVIVNLKQETPNSLAFIDTSSTSIRDRKRIHNYNNDNDI